jgi:hypothetical protein
MDFHLDCECGNRVAVTEGSAGATVDCACGRTIKVPSLSQLRKLHGLEPASLLNPVLLIEHLAAAGELPPGETCIQCGFPTSETLNVVAECEKVWIRRSGGVLKSTLIFFISLLFTPFVIFYRGGVVGVYGRDLILPVPLRVCPDCKPEVEKAAQAWSQASIKQLLRRVTVYDRLLDRYPNARIKLPG